MNDSENATTSERAVAVATTDATGRIRAWSREAEALLGYGAAHIVGRPWHVLEERRGSDDGAPGQSGPPQFTTRLRCSDGSPVVVRHHAVELSSATDGGTAHVLIPVDDDLERPQASDAALLHSEQARMRLLRRLVLAQEEERRRIARDLHDHLGQQLTSLRLKVEAIRVDTVGLSAVQAAVDQADALLTQIDRDIDFLAWELRPAALDDLGLHAVLESFVAEWSRHSGVRARFHGDGLADLRVAPEIEATLYRIAQEALNNVARHARATSVGVVLEQRARGLSLVVEDDGVGFDTSMITPTMLGLIGMRERAAVVGGSLDIEPTAGGGTTVLARVPLYLSEPPLSESAGGASRVLVGAQDGTVIGHVGDGTAERTAELHRAVSARDEFIATVAHELRNPIAPLMFQVRLSIDKTEQLGRAGGSVSPEWACGQLRRIELRLHRFLETLDRLLDVSRLSSGRIDLEYEPVDFVEVLRDVANSFDGEFAVARCELRVRTPPSVVGCWDRLRVDQICRNLVSNAIRFGAGHPVDISVEANDNEVILMVRDRGVGIPKQKRELIFERFERGQEASRSGGFGIGLWMARNVCTAMGGSIAVDSEVGAGSTFTVTLPRRPDRNARVRCGNE